MTTLRTWCWLIVLLGGPANLTLAAVDFACGEYGFWPGFGVGSGVVFVAVGLMMRRGRDVALSRAEPSWRDDTQDAEWWKRGEPPPY